MLTVAQATLEQKRAHLIIPPLATQQQANLPKRARNDEVVAASSSSRSLKPLTQRQSLLPQDIPLSACPQAIMSASLGRNFAEHTLDAKIAGLKLTGYDGIEIHFDCLKDEARRIHSLSATAPLSHAQLCEGARRVKTKCEAAGLHILCLEPFLHYPGLLPLSRREEKLKEVPLWFTIADILGTDMIQIASAMFGGENVTTNEARIVEDLRILADLGLRWPRTKYWAYEAMCFGCGTTTWTQAFRQVQLVDRPNFGLVIDTFQILGAVYADPTLESGKAPDAEAALEATIKEIKATFAGEENAANRAKVFFVQLGDAKKPDTPLSMEHTLWDPDQHANLKMTWGRNYRAFPGEGYMPTLRVADIFLKDCGWRGWISAEVMNQEAYCKDASFPLEAAQRCRAGHDLFLGEMTQT